jgi:hypothetical protein
MSANVPKYRQKSSHGRWLPILPVFELERLQGLALILRGRTNTVRNEFLALRREEYTRVKTERQICKGYEDEMATIAALDHRYYLNPCPSRDERSAYAARQTQWKASRLRFYADLADFRRFKRCRSLICKCAGAERLADVEDVHSRALRPQL